MEKLSYHLEAFDGPLDLLLQLITRNKLDIREIPIAELLDQYLEQVRKMQEENLDVASEFLEMAARLVYMKTVSLLPQQEEAEQLRRELTGQLLEYQECKRVAAMLAGQMTYDTVTRAPLPLPPDLTYRRHHDPRELAAAYLNAVGRGRRLLPPPAESFTGIVARRVVSVSSRIVYVLRRLWKTRRVEYRALFAEEEDRSELVATFLAVLELVKGKRVRVEEGERGAVVALIPRGEKREVWRTTWKSKS